LTHMLVGSGIGAAVLFALLQGSAPAIAAPSLSSGSRVTFAPTRGPVGTLITLSGTLTTADRELVGQADSVTLYIVRGQPDAGLETAVRGQLAFDATGGFRLALTLPDVITWSANPMTGSTAHLWSTPVPSVIEIAWPCRACGLGTFDVTAAALPFTGSRLLPLALVGFLLAVTGSVALALARER